MSKASTRAQAPARIPLARAWLDEVAAEASLPELVDRNGVAELVARILGQRPSKNTLRRWPIRYRMIGRNAFYEASDVIAFVRQRFTEAPIRRAPARKAVSPPRTIL